MILEFFALALLIYGLGLLVYRLTKPLGRVLVAVIRFGRVAGQAKESDIAKAECVEALHTEWRTVKYRIRSPMKVLGLWLLVRIVTLLFQLASINSN